jgi:hypothetical protein
MRYRVKIVVNLAWAWVVLRNSLQSAAIALASISPASPPCFAGDGSLPRYEVYAGADYTGRAAYLSSSTVWSVLGPLAEPGFRLKLDGFANVYGDTGADLFSSGFLAADLKAVGDVMAGYQFNRGSLWVKLYAGAAYQDQMRVIWQAGRITQQQGWGATGAIESFWRPSDRVWASANVTWLQFDNLTSLYSRAAYEVLRMEGGLTISTGGEAALAVSNADAFREGRQLDLYNNYVRAGGLINLRYGTHELTLSGGLSQASDEAAWRPYATLSYGKKF